MRCAAAACASVHAPAGLMHTLRSNSPLELGANGGHNNRALFSGWPAVYGGSNLTPGRCARPHAQKHATSQLQLVARKRFKAALACRASEALAKVMEQVAEQREQEGRSGSHLQKLNRKAKLENRARAHAKVAAGAPGAKAVTHDPYSRKATKVVQYWSTGRKGEDGKLGEKLEDIGKDAQVRTSFVILLCMCLSAHTPVAASVFAIPDGSCTYHVDYPWLADCETNAQMQAKLTAAEELAGLQLATSAGNITPATIMARRLLGPQYRFSSSTKVDRTGKQVISLATYQDKIRHQSYNQLGLDL